MQREVASRPDRVPIAPLLGTPDSRITSFEGGTTKSCATILEDNEDQSPICEQIDDIISIDKINATQYSSPSLPQSQFHRGQVPRETSPVSRSALSSPGVQNFFTNSNNIESPNSIISSIDTAGSISDSFYINSDVVSFANGSQVVDEHITMELEVQSKYQLHSIEEESDAIDHACRGTVQGVYMQSNLDQERNFVIPRSISEQFELMRRC
nr:Protein ZK673.11, isoform a [Haemonchus contortus]